MQTDYLELTTKDTRRDLQRLFVLQRKTIDEQTSCKMRKEDTHTRARARERTQRERERERDRLRRTDDTRHMSTYRCVVPKEETAEGRQLYYKGKTTDEKTTDEETTDEVY